jgi:hypothetical protein
MAGFGVIFGPNTPSFWQLQTNAARYACDRLPRDAAAR